MKSGAPDTSRETTDQTPKEELRWQSRQPTKLLCLTWTDDIKKHMDVIYEKKLCNAYTKLGKIRKNKLMANQNAAPDWLFQDREELEEGGRHLHIKGVVPRLKSE